MYNLIKHTEEHLLQRNIQRKKALHYYPSEASVVEKLSSGKKITHGTCLRQAYYRCTGIEGKPHSATTQLIFRLGKAVENMLVEEWKRMGIYVENSVRWEDVQYNISGELDVILKEPDGVRYLVEVKSFYGYFAEVELFGNKLKPSFPKMSHLLQTLVYVYEFPNLSYARLIYLGRDKAKRIEFVVRLVPDELEDGTIVHRPEIDGNIYFGFTMEDILGRYVQLNNAVKNGQIPEREFCIKYPSETIEEMRAQGEISTLKYNKWKKCKLKSNNDWPGDYQCSYCDYSSLCWKDQLKAALDTHTEEEKDEESLEADSL